MLSTASCCKMDSRFDSQRAHDAMNKFGSYCWWRNEQLNPRMLLFSAGNGAMNAPWYRRNELLRDIGNGAMNSSVILATAQCAPSKTRNCTKMPVPMLRPVQIHWRLYKENGEAYFRLWKTDIQKKCRLSLRRDEISFLVFPIDNSCIRWRCNFKGLSQHGGRMDITGKTPRLIL